jgi:2-keto-4-pentenoate hydratase/2-oxohepta-3-ene-1,7-dioic acid hydratase in catechol pathway
MKILRLGAPGFERAALLDSRGRPRDLSSILPDVTPEALADTRLAALRQVDPEKLPLCAPDLRIGAPVSRIGKIVGVGLNYRDHAAETGQSVPTEPILFLKAGHTVQGPNDPVRLPRGSLKSDWEVELGIVIGRRALYVPETQGLDPVAGYCVCNDLSERSFQMERGGQWDKGKNCATFGPVGPWLVTKDELVDPQRLGLWLEVNGRRYQNGNTRTMIFDVRFLVHYISQFMPLEPGDIISTGTPPGVGLGQKPPVYLKAGDRIRLGIEGLGEQDQRVIAHDA